MSGNATSGPNYLKRVAIGEDVLNYVGCHYLRGAAGATPDARNGASFRPGHVEWHAQQIKDPNRAVVWSAYSWISEKQICAGRYRTVPLGREIHRDDPQLKEYLDKLRSLPSALFWESKDGLTPRLANWTIPKGIMTKLVWGEDCRNVRHFDCLGLLGFVLTKLGVKMAGQFTVPMYEARTEACSPTSKPWPADIVTLDHHHIGILADENTVVQAKEGPIGVVKGPYKPGDWSRRGRIRDNDL